MSSNPTFAGLGVAFAMTAACLFALSALVLSKPSLAQTGPEEGTRAITQGSEAAKALNAAQPRTGTREERLSEKPLDWNSTIGKPTPRTLTPREEEALRKAPAEKTEGGAPNPNAEAEARKLHPEDWK